MLANEELTSELISFYGTGPHYPSADQWRSLLNSEHNGKIVMLNLVKLADEAEHPYDANVRLSGAELMLHYESISSAAVARVGGKTIYSGLLVGAIIGEQEWDAAACVEYPSIDAFIRLFQDPEYRKSHLYRAAGCSDHRLILSLPV
ncbi:MAG: DUF1330 domain-containing protein [Halioglobus sp.]